MDTPNLAFTLLRPGATRIDANPDTETTTITVRAGDGEVTGGGQAFTVHPNQMAHVTGNDSVTYDLQQAQPADYFEEWAMSRARQEDHSESARYVSRGMIGYEDLDAKRCRGGRFLNMARYGFRELSRQVGRPIVMATGPGSNPGAGLGLTMHRGGSRPSTMAVGR